MKRRFISNLAIVAFLASTMTATAHGIWVAQRHGDHAIVYGHGSSDESYDPAKLTSLAGKKADGSNVTVAIDQQEDHVLLDVPEDTAIIVSTFDNGYWSEGPDGKWVNKAKDEVEGAKQGGRYLKYTTAVLGHTEGSPKPQGLGFEIVPLRDPTELKAGDQFEVQVLLKGQPAAGVVMIGEYTTDSDNKSIKTGPDGKATITIRNQGLNVVAASFDEELKDDPKADSIGHFATLSFNLHYHSE